MIRESVIESAVVKWAKANGISTLKLSGPNARGQADRLFMRAGKVVFAEMKSPGKSATALQEKFLAERRADGFSAEVFDNAGLAIQWLKREFEI